MAHLRECLADPDPEVAAIAAQSLGLLGDRASAATIGRLVEAYARNAEARSGNWHAITCASFGAAVLAARGVLDREMVMDAIGELASAARSHSRTSLLALYDALKQGDG